MAHDHAPRQHLARRRVLWAVLVANGIALVGEAVGGVVFASLALLADAAHLLSDVGGLAIALLAHSLTVRPASERHSFGLQRAEVLGAQANGVLLVASAGWIGYEGVRRLFDPGARAGIEGEGLLVVALLGLVVNVVSAVALARVAGGSLNLRGALVHMIADAAGSVAAVIAGIAVIVAGATWVDPAVSLLIAVLVLWAAAGLLREAAHVLLEGTPKSLDVDEVRRSIEEAPGITGVHHLHVWSLASEVPALSAHVVVEGDVGLHDAQARGDDLRAMLRERFGVGHATLELECHECDDIGHRQGMSEEAP